MLLYANTPHIRAHTPSFAFLIQRSIRLLQFPR